ncbi:MAG TPA: ferric reductase-like transmembrane domain-containing protein [Ktedonobacterales bacterium]|jgi:ferric reductase like protein|nr:ferric reductase-like transmembrane domain-containing protein [Ktedonobacterales bacterium]
MSGWSAITWDVARAGGFTAFLLLTLSVALGLALSLKLQTPRWPRLINNELHNFVTVVTLVFIGVHILAVWLDPFTQFGLNEILVPFASHYRPIWMGLGIVAAYLALAIALSVYIRPRIGYAWWRRLHYLTFAVYALTLVHGVATGSDTRTWWGIAIYGGSALLVTALLWRRLARPMAPGGRAHPALANLILAGAFILVVWTLLGPLQANWNASANNGAGSGQRSSAQVTLISDVELTSARTSVPSVSMPIIVDAILPSTEPTPEKDASENETQ